MNSKKSEALSCIRAALAAVEKEREKPGGERVADSQTLLEFRDALKRMEEDVALERLRPSGERRGGMGRVIVDSWPTSSVLGGLVIRAEKEFLEL